MWHTKRRLFPMMPSYWLAATIVASSANLSKLHLCATKAQAIGQLREADATPLEVGIHSCRVEHLWHGADV